MNTVLVKVETTLGESAYVNPENISSVVQGSYNDEKCTLLKFVCGGTVAIKGLPDKNMRLLFGVSR